MDKIKKLKEIIDNSKNICVFTGAGISCPSGIPDFRSADGLYNRENSYKYRPEEIISHSFFEQHVELFYDFYKNSMLYPDAQPNAAHKYFAELQNKTEVSVITQNIDGLHQAAGSKEVVELHGSVHRNYCTRCGKFYPLSYIAESKGVPCCEEDGAVIKPDVVLYEEPLDMNVVTKAIDFIRKADTLIVIGTSLVVYPAASYIGYFRGNNLVLINKSKTNFDSNADLTINDDIINVINEIKKV